MARWTDLAAWVGPTINEGDGDNRPNEAADRLADVRGLVLHIASGFYDGTIAWQRNASADVSSHFIVARDGRCAQMVDTADRSWAQRSGNSTWLSVELEGFAPDDRLHASHPGWERLTPAQIEVCARLLARVHQVYGVPLQLATSPSGRGLGHHSMGAESGIDWGHSQCPGSAIKGQKAAILARAVEVTKPAATAAEDGDEMSFANQPILPDITSAAVPGGDVAWRPTWLAICNETFGAGYALRIYTTTGNGAWTPIDEDGLIKLGSGQIFSKELPTNTRCVSIKRMAIDEFGRVVEVVPPGGVSTPRVAYDGSLSFALER